MASTIQTMDKLYAWVEIGDDGREGILAATVLVISPAPVALVARDRRVADAFGAADAEAEFAVSPGGAPIAREG